MKQLLIIGLLLTSFPASSQLNIVNTDLANKDSSILFDEYVNHVEIVGVKNFSHLGVSVNNGMVTWLGGGKLLVRTNAKKRLVRLHVFQFNDEDDKQDVLLTRTFKVQPIGPPSVSLIREEDGILSNNQRINNTRLEVFFPNKNYQGSREIAHFELTATQPDGSVLFKSRFISGKYLTIKTTDQLKQLKKGGRIQFDQVVLYDRDNSYQKLPSFSVAY